jgi:large subunit ribosomal protein L24
MHKIKKGDEIIVIAGKDKGKRGLVLNVLLKGQKLMVENINTVKKHVKANPNANNPGGIVLQNMAIQASNVMLYCPETGKGSRVGIRALTDGRLVRYFKSNDQVVDVDV